MSQTAPTTQDVPAVPIKPGAQILMLVLPVILLSFSIVATGLRFQSRIVKKLPIGLDDLFCLVALMFAIGLYIDSCIMIVYGGLGTSILSLQPGNLITFGKTLVALGTLWSCAVACIQLSILWFYVRLFGIRRWFKIACFCVMGLVVAWWLAIFFGTMLQCVPLSKTWDPMEPGQCANPQEACGGTGISHVLIDFILLFLPLPVIWKLQTSNTRKMLLTGVFVIGIFATMCSILRTSCLVGLNRIDESDITGTGWLSLLFELLEVMCGLFCVCIPTFPAVWVQFLDSRVGTYFQRVFSFTRLGSSRRSDPKDSENNGLKHNKNGPGGSSERLNKSVTRVHNKTSSSQDHEDRNGITMYRLEPEPA